MAFVEVAVVPRAAANRVGPYAEGILRVRVVRPPTDGEANRAVIRLVAGALGMAPSGIELIAGRSARRKRLRSTASTPTSSSVASAPLPAD